ncbi:MAG TPA: PAS domain-containing protein, partial [Mesorhizobium sp.]|nr:PAS domain-containing protein [Mesorhizobium sp.]
MPSRDWSTSPLGAPETWPQSLRCVVGLLLASKFPMFVAWGPELGFLYNDPYAEILGAKHPDALGRRFHDIWAEIWPDISPLIDAALAGEATFHEDLPLVMNRRGFEEQTWFTFSYSPVRDESGQVAGMFCAVAETTAKVLGERRQAFHLELEERLRALSDPRAIIEAAQEALGLHLNANRVGYGEVEETARFFTTERNWTDGSVPSRAGTHDLAGFGPDVLTSLRAGVPLLIPDIAADPRLNSPEIRAAFESIDTRAVITASLVKEGRMRAALYVHASQPRPWTSREAEVVTEVAERTWSAVERARAEAALRASNNRFQSAVEAANGFIWTNDAQGKMVGEQPGWAALTGQSVAEYQGYGWADAVHPEDAQPTIDAWNEAVRERKPFIYEHRVRRRDGAWRRFSVRAVPTVEVDGSIREWVGIHSDITDERETAEALRAETEALETLNRTGAAVAAELDLERVVQRVTDAGVELTGAQFGAFFYNVLNEAGESYMLYTLSGAQRSDFENFGMPRATAVFHPTFVGEGVIRADDILADARYGKNDPHLGMPKGHLPVRS